MRAPLCFRGYTRTPLFPEGIGHNHWYASDYISAYLSSLGINRMIIRIQNEGLNYEGALLLKDQLYNEQCAVATKNFTLPI